MTSADEVGEGGELMEGEGSGGSAGEAVVEEARRTAEAEEIEAASLALAPPGPSQVPEAAEGRAKETEDVEEDDGAAMEEGGGFDAEEPESDRAEVITSSGAVNECSVKTAAGTSDSADVDELDEARCTSRGSCASKTRPSRAPPFSSVSSSARIAGDPTPPSRPTISPTRASTRLLAELVFILA